MIRRLLALLCLLPLCVSPASSRSSLEQQIQAQRAKAQAVHERLSAKREELHVAKVRVGNLQAQLADTNSAIAGVNSRLSDLQAQQRSTERRLAWNTVQLSAAQATLARHTKALDRRLVDIYEHGDLGYIDVLLASTSFSDFVERWDDLRLLIAANQRAVAQRRAAEKQVAHVQSALLSTQAELQASQAAQERARNQLTTLASERANLVAVADNQRRHIASEVAEMEDLSSQEEAQLEALIQERERQLEAERLARLRAQGVTTATSSAPPGALIWPVTGTITSPFGPRPSPFGGGTEFHQGLDIAADTGTPIKAAADGTVLSAGWYGGYGNYILIDHGGGISTGYGHCSAIYVSVGQTVQRGQAIGAVGSTGASTGPHLHFEVRVNGHPVDPASRLR